MIEIPPCVVKFLNRSVELDMNDAETKVKTTASPLGAAPWPVGGAIRIVGDMGPAIDLSLRSFRNQAEKDAISHALRHTGWNRKRAARLLSISYRSLLYKIRRHKISPAVERN